MEIKQARSHAKIYGPGIIPEIKTKHRVRLDMGKVDHFVDFINRPYFYQDVSYGNKVLTIDNDDRIEMSNVVRILTRSTMIEQYLEYCKEQCHETLSRSTLFKILEVREASQRKSLQGLDNTAADGAAGFQTIETSWEKKEWKNSGVCVFAKTYAMLNAISKLTTVCTVNSTTLLVLTTVERLRLVILLIPSYSILVRISINRLANNAKG